MTPLSPVPERTLHLVPLTSRTWHCHGVSLPRTAKGGFLIVEVKGAEKLASNDHVAIGINPNRTRVAMAGKTRPEM